MGLPMLTSQITVPTGGWTFDVTVGGVSTITVAAGDWDLFDLLDDIGDSLFAVDASFVLAINSTSDTATGRVSITGPWTAVAWTSTALRDVLGYLGSESIATGGILSASKACSRLWLPGVGRMPMEPDPSSASEELGQPEYDYIFADAPSGVAAVAVTGVRYKLPVFLFENLRGHQVWRSLELVVNESWDSWVYELAATEGGAPFRYYPDRTNTTVYWDLVFEDLTELRATPVEKGWVGTYSLWIVGPFRVRKYVPS